MLVDPRHRPGSVLIGLVIVGLALLVAACETAPRTRGEGATARDQTSIGRTVDNGPADAPEWRVGDEWTYRWESPRGKGTFVRRVIRIERIGGIEFYVTRSGQYETYWWS
jgi:hypothetical protein